MKNFILLAVVVFAAYLLAPLTVFASTASVYLSPSSKTITKGDSVTIQVRVNSGANTFDTAEARINYNSSRLQYVGYSAGSLSTISANNSSGSFKYSGFVLPPYLSGDKAMFSITFKSIATGTASMSLSEVQVLYGGNPLTTSSGSGSVTINNPPSSGGSTGGTKPIAKPKTSTSTGTSKPAVPEPETDTTAPKLSAEPVFDKTMSTITAGFKTDEASKAVLSYQKDGGEKKQLSSDELKKEHNFDIGKDDPLEPGTSYKLELVLSDEAGNASDILSYGVKTSGVTYKVKIVDSNGQPLRNHPVQLNSDPIDATTDNNGVAEFNDVTPGEHTLVFEIEGITVRQPVLIGNTLNLADAESDPETVSMPFQLGQAAVVQRSSNWLVWAGLSFIAGMAIMKLPVRQLASKVRVLAKPKVTAGKSKS